MSSVLTAPWEVVAPGTDRPAAASPEATSANTEANGWPSVIDELLRIRDFTDDWDGEGSVAPGAELVDAALTLGRYLTEGRWPAPARVVAGVNGTVVFEWYGPKGFTELEVVSPLRAEQRWYAAGTERPALASVFVRRPNRSAEG